jgi:hypothetical protein
MHQTTETLDVAAIGAASVDDSLAEISGNVVACAVLQRFLGPVEFVSTKSTNADLDDCAGKCADADEESSKQNRFHHDRKMCEVKETGYEKRDFIWETTWLIASRNDKATISQRADLVAFTCEPTVRMTPPPWTKKLSLSFLNQHIMPPKRRVYLSKDKKPKSSHAIKHHDASRIPKWLRDEFSSPDKKSQNLNILFNVSVFSAAVFLFKNFGDMMTL